MELFIIKLEWFMDYDRSRSIYHVDKRPIDETIQNDIQLIKKKNEYCLIYSTVVSKKKKKT